ncbi:hypothetical protein G4Y79_15625 [Phototrophicus methaneseepsis]|uniref:Uncharacterized protein n=1 Tax=Phototrophicus methaneseepsis TaxID=2710758 RepID=A0A7S8ID28_9CHLR|nr:hypothetical protein [Phototrophicus methaneseepsis]QPC81132.1 hypothetical protein G4Y79_15625 [Phototrophicus methaneseepsis]
METIIQLLQGLNIDFGNGVGLALCCSLACVVVIVLVVGLQAVGVAFESVAHLAEFLLGILAGGPLAWCGCLVAIGVLMGCGVVAMGFLNVMGTCGTPAQVNLCRLLGY